MEGRGLFLLRCPSPFFPSQSDLCASPRALLHSSLDSALFPKFGSRNLKPQGRKMDWKMDEHPIHWPINSRLILLLFPLYREFPHLVPPSKIENVPICVQIPLFYYHFLLILRPFSRMNPDNAPSPFSLHLFTIYRAPRDLWSFVSRSLPFHRLTKWISTSLLMTLITIGGRVKWGHFRINHSSPVGSFLKNGMINHHKRHNFRENTLRQPTGSELLGPDPFIIPDPRRNSDP